MQPQTTNIPDPAVPPVPAPPITTPPVSQSPMPSSAVGQAPNTGATPDVADDGDLIEKEWVNKVKQVLHDAHNDPFKQSQALALLRADYMQKRYGKTIKSEQ